MLVFNVIAYDRGLPIFLIASCMFQKYLSLYGLHLYESSQFAYGYVVYIELYHAYLDARVCV